VAYKPIETAPKDGARILLYDDGDVHIGYYEEASIGYPGGWVTLTAACIENCAWCLNPSLWDYLPDPNVIEGDGNAVEAQGCNEVHQEGHVQDR
jgi:hypothetical protein